jgi:hypothetical protein
VFVFGLLMVMVMVMVFLTSHLKRDLMVLFVVFDVESVSIAASVPSFSLSSSVSLSMVFGYC